MGVNEDRNEDEVALTNVGLLSCDRPSLPDDGEPAFTVDQAIEEAGFGYFQWKVLFMTGAIWASDAMEVMFITFIIPILRTHWNLKAPYDSLIGVLVFAGMFVGSFGWARLADMKGRRKIVIVTNIIVAVFGTLSALSPNIYWMLVFRTIVGFGVAGSSVAYTLFAEYCPSSFRGKALIMEQGCWSGGALLSVLFAWVTLTNLGEDIGWRCYIALSALPCWMMVMASAIIPESARYYAASGQRVEADKILKSVFRDNGRPYPEGKLVVGNWGKTGKVSDLFVPAYRATSAILLMSFFNSTFCYYGICFISERLFRHGSLYFAMFLTTLSEVPGIFFGVLVLDYTGRRGMMNICWFLFSVLAVIISLLPPSEKTGDLQRGFDIMFVFVARCAVSTLFYTLYVYYSEYYPTVIRSTALGIGSAIGRVAGMITTVVAEDLNLVSAMMIYSLFGFFTLFLTVMLPQDTTGMEMKDQVDFSSLELKIVNDENGDEVQELSHGIKGRFQQLKAYAT